MPAFSFFPLFSTYIYETGDEMTNNACIEPALQEDNSTQQPVQYSSALSNKYLIMFPGIVAQFQWGKYKVYKMRNFVIYEAGAQDMTEISNKK